MRCRRRPRGGLSKAPLQGNMHFLTQGTEPEQGEHVLRAEAYAAVRNRCADAGRIACAVDVDVAGAGVGIAGLQPVER